MIIAALNHVADTITLRAGHGPLSMWLHAFAAVEGLDLLRFKDTDEYTEFTFTWRGVTVDAHRLGAALITASFNVRGEPFVQRYSRAWHPALVLNEILIDVAICLDTVCVPEDA